MAPVAFHRPLTERGLVWVAEDGDTLLGFATCEAFDDALHLWELAVRREAQGRGAGRALLAAVATEARARRLPAVTLTTFRNIPWNAPFYARCGYASLTEGELTPRLAAVRTREATLGLDIANRCVMRLVL